MNDFLTKILLAASDWSKNLGGFDLSKSILDADILVGLFLGVVVLLIAFGVGKTRMLLAILSTYAALVVGLFFPFYRALEQFFPANLKGVEFFWSHALVFVIGFGLSFFILNRSTLKSKMSLKESSPLIILWLSIVETGFLTATLLSYWRPEGSSFKISPLLSYYFGSGTAQFVWVLLPLLSIFLVKHSRRAMPS